jgi:hypothetical protein
MSRYDDRYRGARDRSTRAGGRHAGEYGRYFTPFPGDAGYPSARWGWGPMGWAGDVGPEMGLWPAPGARGPAGGAYDREVRRPPRESSSYGRAGDREIRRWAGRYGYDIDHTIRPRR